MPALIPPNVNGQATMANSAPVVIASNQTAVPVIGTRLNDGSSVVSGGQHLAMGGSDGTNNRIVKTTTDGRLIEEVSPAEVTSATITGTGTIATVNIASFSSFSLKYHTGGVAATLNMVAEVSDDGGSTWHSPYPPSQSAPVLLSNITTNRDWFVGITLSSVTTASSAPFVTSYPNVSLLLRIRCTSYTSGTVYVTVVGVRNSPPGIQLVQVVRAETAAVTATPTQGVLAQDITSAARTSSGASSIATSVQLSYGSVISVTAASGTLPTMDLVLQESYDNGNSLWYDKYHVERITTTGTWYVPPLPQAGKHRWVYTIGGSTPSFTFKIDIMSSWNSYPIQVQYFDRTANLLNGTAGTASAAYNAQGCKSLAASVTLGAAALPATYKLQGSPDGANFFDLSAPVAGIANSTVGIFGAVGLSVKFVRVICVDAGVSQTGTVVAIMGSN